MSFTLCPFCFMLKLCVGASESQTTSPTSWLSHTYTHTKSFMQVENRSASSFNTAMQATGYGNHTAMPTHWNNNVQDFLITFLMYNGRLQNEKKKDKVYKGGSSQGWGLQSPRECHEGVFLSTRDTAFTRINSIGTICTTFDSFFFLFFYFCLLRGHIARRSIRFL